MQERPSRRVARRGCAFSLVTAAVVLGLALPAGASSASEWSKAYCKAQDKFTNAMETANDETTAAARELSTATDLTAIVGTLETGITKVKKSADGVVKAMKKVGTPDIKNGANVQKAGVKAFSDASDSLATGLTALEDVDVADRTDTGPVLDAAGSLSDAANATSDFLLDTLYNATKKDRAFAAAFAKACR